LQATAPERGLVQQWPTACAAVHACVCKGVGVRVQGPRRGRAFVHVCFDPCFDSGGGDERDGDGHEMVVSVRILRCNDGYSRDHARCLSIAMMPRETAAPNAASGHGTTAGPTRCAAHRLPAAVTELGHLRACGKAPWWIPSPSEVGSIQLWIPPESLRKKLPPTWIESCQQEAERENSSETWGLARKSA
jgi:hypothetical protein